MTDILSQNQALPKTIPQYDESHYAVVDLGSNSFHLLITQLITSPTGKSIKTVNKVKQKVRLAAGLTSHNLLTDEAITRGLDCLKNFALYLNSIPVNNTLIVATAALRIAKNNQVFFDAAKKILPKEIKLLSGEQEAKTIYAGVAHTSISNIQQSATKQLVLDIGGASTEIIVGLGCTAKKVVSLDIGCVSFIGKYFTNDLLNKENFNQCIAGAADIINTVKAEFIQLGWQSAVGSSGTMQAMAEILIQRQQTPIITLEFLYEIQQTLIKCKTIDSIEIAGLRADRKAILASGLSILIALFQCLHIEALCLSSGALREGLLFELVPDAKII
ncbi:MULTISPECIES: Ppx/GppA phosphatase family protein [Colwellia]|uniref:Phosphatase, Ppx/GppA family n=1 Tax=Colwellia psychrerythraea (strain 34H / ATCC BAA-681) TaxID=167879 RepID=Q48AH2_COLP3|nr:MULTISPECIES: Ppx/GppA phosphatase [Colwellia]AAZ27325.1 phosphatase, Ppx/GppA family [Colwellia psychrerythraea 34H]